MIAFQVEYVTMYSCLYNKFRKKCQGDLVVLVRSSRSSF